MSAQIIGLDKVKARLLREQKRAGRATAAGLHATARAAQLEIRTVVRAAFPGRGGRGRRVENAVRMAVYDNGPKGGAASVWSAFGRGRGKGNFVDFIAPRLFGAHVTPQRGRWLLIPLQASAELGGGGRGQTRGSARRIIKRLEDMTTTRVKGRGTDRDRIKLIPIKGGRAMLFVRETKTRTTPLALLVKNVRYPQRISRASLTGRALRGLPLEIARAYQSAA